MYEELLADGENTTKTYHEKIMIAKTQELDADLVKAKIETLTTDFNELDGGNLVAFMKNLVPEYVSQNSEFEKLDKVSS